jgi:hypothetical protein
MVIPEGVPPDPAHRFRTGSVPGMGEGAHPAAVLGQWQQPQPASSAKARPRPPPQGPQTPPAGQDRLQFPHVLLSTR